MLEPHHCCMHACRDAWLKEATTDLKLKLGTNNFANKNLWNPWDFEFNDKYGIYRDSRRSLQQGSAEAAIKNRKLLLLDSNKTLHGDYHQLRNLNFARSDYIHYYYYTPVSTTFHYVPLCVSRQRIARPASNLDLL